MPQPASRRHLLLPVTFFWVFFGLASVQPFVVPYMREEFGVSELGAITVLASVYLVLGIARFFVSHVIRRIGKKATILLGVCGYVLFPVILLFSRGFVSAMFASLSLGIGGALLWTASSAQVLDVSEKEAYGRASGILQFFTTSGILFGTFFYGFLARRSDGRYAQALLKAVSQLAGGVEMDARYAVVFATAGVLGIVALASAAVVPRVRTEVKPPRFGEMLKFITTRERLFAPVILMIQFGTYGIMLTMTNQYVKGQPGGEDYWVKVHACYLGAGVAVSYIAGWISDRIGRKNTLFACFAFAAAGLFVFSFARSFPMFAIAAGMLGVVFGGVQPVALAYVGDISTPENRPSVHAFVYAWRDFGLVATCYVRLGLSKHVSPQVCYVAFGGLFVAVAVWMFVSARVEARRAATPPT
ncbi:MAG: MFS transporter [Planctomycetes bacterium]|nr:MFS transporter [Planctomycetota bacterium]